MGNHKLMWTAEEEAALIAGIAKHGPGKWKNILLDADFSFALQSRSNIDLKDKYRNMTVSATGERQRSSKSSHMALPSTAKNLVSGSAHAHLTTRTQDATPVAALDDSPSESPESNNASEFDAMIFDALKASNNSKGSDTGMIVRYIEERCEAPSNLKKLLGTKLRRLVSQGKLNKLENRYTIRNDSAVRVGSVGLKQKQSKPQHKQRDEWLKSLMEACEAAAYYIAVAERKSFLGYEAVKEADRISELADETDCYLEIAKAIYERCSRGEAVYVNLTSHKLSYPNT